MRIPTLRAPAVFVLALVASGLPAQAPDGFDKAWKGITSQYHELCKAQGMVGSSLGFFHASARPLLR